MTEYAKLLRLLAEKVYSARLSTGQPVRDTTDFNGWLIELGELAEQSVSLEEFVEKI